MKKKILVVDDNRMMLNFMINLLEREGHEVFTADDGISALDMVTSFAPDMIFIDLILPRIGGDLLCRIFRNMQHIKDCYLVILSGALAEAENDLAGIGADTCIAKGPFNQMSHHILSTLKEAAKPKKDRRPGQVLGLEDVHPRQMTKELFFRKRHLEDMLESVAEGILEISSGRIVYANAAAISMTGLPIEALLSSHPLDIFDKASRSRVDKMLHSKKETPLEIGLHKPLELNNRLINLKLVPIKELPSSNIMLITDVTSRTRMAMELQHARKMEAIGTIASGVAHNFRNTLAAILANAQIIQMNYQNDEKLIEINDRINSSVHRGEQLVNRLLEFSYKEITREFQPVDLVSLIQTTNQLMQISFNKKINIHISVPDALYILGDHSGLSSVLMNLCNNARNAMPEGGTLSIKARRKGRQAIVTISDTGQGMDAKTLERCFDPFFTTREIGKGTGLGLSTAYGIVKSHNGHISIKSKPNEGSVFKIVFPVASDSGEKPEITPIENARISKFNDRKSKQILIVDDEPAFLNALTQLIETLGYRTRSAQNGSEVIDIYKTWRPDIVLMDIGIPEMDGINVAKQIISYDPAASIVLMSGYSANRQFGANPADQKLFKGYLTKPIDLNDLSRLLGQFNN